MKIFGATTIYLLLFLSSSLYSQVLKVIDSQSKNPIPHVLIFSNDWSVVTDNSGEANITGLPDNTLITFQHPSYHQLIIPKTDIGSAKVILLNEKIINIQGVVVSAQRWEQDIAKVPQEILGLSKKEIEETQPQTAADMLEATGQVFVQKSQHGGGSPMLRGFAANNVLLVVDGVRMNNAIYRSGNLQNVINIDPLSLEGSEVIFGPGSVMYGSDALGGVMDFHTVTPRFSTYNQFLANTLVRYSSASNEKTVHADVAVRRTKMSVYSSSTLSLMDDLRSGGRFNKKYPAFGKNLFYVKPSLQGDKVIDNPDPSVQRPSGYNLFSTVNKVRFRLNNFDLTYGLYFSTTNNIPRYDRLVETDDAGIPVYALWYYGPQRWLMNSLKGEYFQKMKLADRVRIIIANQQVKESRHDRRFNSNSLRNQQEELAIWSANIDFEKALRNTTWYYGGEWVRNTIESEANRVDLLTIEKTSTPSRYPSNGSFWNSYSGYTSLSHAFERLSLSAGVRYSYVTLSANGEPSGFISRKSINVNNGSFSGSVGGVYNINKNLRIKSSLSSGFRAPNVDDVGKIFEVTGNTLTVPNENLGPQHTYSTELGLVYSSEKWLFNLTAYNTWVQQVMTRAPYTLNGQSTFITEDGSELQVVALVNSGSAIINGLSGSLEHAFNEKLGFSTYLTYTYGKEDDGTPLRHIPPVFGQTKLSFKRDAFNCSLFLNYQFEKKTDDIPYDERTTKPHLFTVDGNVPAWFTLNINSAYYLPKGFVARLNLENILDAHYRTFSSGISAPGRNISISIVKTFFNNSTQK